MLRIKRTFWFKIIVGLVFCFLLFILVNKIIDLYNATDAEGFKINDEINQRNEAYARLNPFGFTDKIRQAKKPKGVYRIAVLGDSFIWGDGLPYEKIWSHKLEVKLLTEYDSIEVLSWGICGWSTLDEFNFFKEHGKDFDIDLLIIGWVDNDPDVGKIKRVEVGGDAQQKFPLIYKLYPPLARALINNVYSNGSDIWMRKIYEEQNLRDYQNVLNEFRQYLIRQKVNTFIVMTPAAFLNDVEKEHFKIAKPLLIKANFACIDLFASSEKLLERYPLLQLQANRTNAHPGDILTELYADTVASYLEQNRYLSNLHKKGL